MAPGSEPISRAANMSYKDSASKRKRVNRSTKVKQCKLEARREQWLANQVKEEKQGQKSLHDPGEVLHPEFSATEALLPMNSRVSWASLLNSSVSTETQKNPDKTPATTTEPDPELLRANSNSHTYLCIKRPESSPSPTSECTFYECTDMDASPKSCEDRSPKSKASKVGKGSRRSRGDRRNSKENECIVAQQKKENKGQERKLDGIRAHAHLQDRPYCYTLETEDSWEAAADAMGLHSAPKKSSSGVLQVKATHCNDQCHTRTQTTPLLGGKPAKQPGLQHSTHQRAWVQNDLRRPTSLPRLNKQRGLRVSTCLDAPLDKPQCPICIEDLDSTDTSFDLCPCGFKLCLFCYHKIASENGRCPGCRGVYIRDVSAKHAVLPR